MTNPIHILKLSVGTEGVEDLAAWQASQIAGYKDGLPRHVTRMWPKKEVEILNGGSVFWVIKGLIQCRQRIVRFDEVIGGDGIRRCAFVLDPELIRTSQVQKRPFQGWRYLAATDAPPDIPIHRGAEETLPPELAAALADIGLM